MEPDYKIKEERSWVPKRRSERVEDRSSSIQYNAIYSVPGSPSFLKRMSILFMRIMPSFNVHFHLLLLRVTLSNWAQTRWCVFWSSPWSTSSKSSCNVVVFAEYSSTIVNLPQDEINLVRWWNARHGQGRVKRSINAIKTLKD